MKFLTSRLLEASVLLILVLGNLLYDFNQIII
jgi:hypothetical protein